MQQRCARRRPPKRTAERRPSVERDEVPSSARRCMRQGTTGDPNARAADPLGGSALGSATGTPPLPPYDGARPCTPRHTGRRRRPKRSKRLRTGSDRERLGPAGGVRACARRRRRRRRALHITTRRTVASRCVAPRRIASASAAAAGRVLALGRARGKRQARSAQMPPGVRPQPPAPSSARPGAASRPAVCCLRSLAPQGVELRARRVGRQRRCAPSPPSSGAAAALKAR